MDVAYSNAERLIRTELNAVETRASADAMKAADFDYYQFAATLDRRTCPICGERDGEVYPLTAMNQGENAPPMHPRCRCTIVASMEGVGRGQRAAEGRSRVPADMSYRDWLKSLTPAAGANDTMSAGNIPSWPPRDKEKIIPKEEYSKLRALAEANGIFLIGVKNFDGSPVVVREILDTLIDLKNNFPAVSDNRAGRSGVLLLLSPLRR